ncbi:MAG: TolC family protein [Nitrospiraceae bacterium]|nr:TolC family protein [Nitrospiraceae bacterium]
MKRVLRHIMLYAAVLILTGNTCLADEPGVLTLSKGINIALQQNRNIRISALDRSMSEDDRATAKARFYPEIETSLSQVMQAKQPAALSGSQIMNTAQRNYLTYDLIIQQSIYTFGATTALFDASGSALDVAKLNHQRQKNLVALSFVVTYFDLLESEQLIKAAESEIKNLDAQLILSKNLYAAGSITKNDLLHAEVRLSDARQKLLAANNQRDINASVMNSILTRPLSSIITVVEPVVPASREESLDNALEFAKANRIELSIFNQQIKISEFEEKAKESDFLPSVFARGGYNYNENRYQLHEDNWSIMLGARMSLFSGGATKAAISKIRHRREQLLEQKAKTADDISLEVRKNFLDMQNAGKRIEVTGEAISQAEENLRINRIRYEEGIGTATEVIDAITMLTTATTNYYKALYEYRRAQANLLYSMGMNLAAWYGGSNG